MYTYLTEPKGSVCKFCVDAIACTQATFSGVFEACCLLLCYGANIKRCRDIQAYFSQSVLS